MKILLSWYLKCVECWIENILTICSIHASQPILGNILLKLSLLLLELKIFLLFILRNAIFFLLPVKQPMWVEGACSVEFDSSSSNAKSPPLYPQRVSPHHLIKQQPNRAKTPSNSNSDSEAGPSSGSLAFSSSESELEIKVEVWY